jgi:AraC-like DNA-binding protein
MSETASSASATSYIGNVLGVARTMDAYGLNGTVTLIEAGVDVHATPGFDARVPTNLLHKALLNNGTEKLDPLFGLKFAEFVNPTTYHAFGVMLTSSTTLRTLCQRIERYFAYINTADRVRFTEELELSYQQLALPEFIDEPFESLMHESAWAATMLKLIRMVSQPDYAPLEVKLAFARPEGYTEQYDAYFRCPISYSASQTALCFSEEDSDKPLPGGNAELARHSEVMVYNYLKTFTEIDIENAARMSLFDLLPRGDFSLASLAQSLETTEDDLSTKLKACGTSYQQLLGDTRRELSEEYIMRSDLSVNEIAYMLGFSDCSNFARSFRRWTGLSPSDFRDQLHKGH